MGNGVSLCNTVGLKRQLTILCVGLDNAGKTCVTRALVGESVDNITPTIGFSKFTTKLEGVTVNIYDLGGGAKIRDIWNNYFVEAHGIVFVFDSSDTRRLREARNILKTLMTNSLIRGKPLLLLANKQDNDDAMDEVDISESLHLEELANECQSPTRIEICCATQGTGRNMDPTIRIGFQWLVASVLHNFDTIHRRVLDGTAIQIAEEEKEREERKQRIQKMNDLTKNPIKNEEKDLSFKGDPFRPVNEILESWNLPGAVFTEVGYVATEVNVSGLGEDSRGFSSALCHKAGVDREPEAGNVEMEMNPNTRLKTCSLPPLLPPVQHELNYESSESMSPYGTTISKSLFNRNNRTAPLNEDTSINTVQRVSDKLPPLK